MRINDRLRRLEALAGRPAAPRLCCQCGAPLSDASPLDLSDAYAAPAVRSALLDLSAALAFAPDGSGVLAGVPDGCAACWQRAVAADPAAAEAHGRLLRAMAKMEALRVPQDASERVRTTRQPLEMD